MAFPTSEVDRLFTNNTSEVGLKDEDSGLRLYRGITSPWGAIKGFKETYTFLIRHASLIAVGYMNSMRILEPDYEKSQSLMSGAWGTMMDYSWIPGSDAMKGFEERFEVPPFWKDGVIRGAIYADKGDQMTLIPGHIWYTSNDRFEKEIHKCMFDIAGPETCDMSVGGGSHFIYGISCRRTNGYDPERIGCGDDYCVACQESKKKYGKHNNTPENDEFGPEGYEWEGWGPTGGGLRDQGMPHKANSEHLDTGVYEAATGATWTTGEMYKDMNMWPLAYSYCAIEAMRHGLSDEKKALVDHVVDTIFEVGGKFQFAEATARKAAREWMDVPTDLDDGRVMGGYISMVLQARDIEWKFVEFEAEKTVIECNRTKLAMLGMYPEYIKAYKAYFNGAVKTLVDATWTVEAIEDVDNDTVTFTIQKAPYGFRRQKPNLHDYENAK